MPDIKLNRIEETQVEAGSALMTVGEVLLWADFLFLAFVDVGLRSGSDFWVWWVIIEGALGLILIEVGSRKRGSLTH